MPRLYISDSFYLMPKRVKTSNIACIVEHEGLYPYWVGIIIECLLKKERVFLQINFSNILEKSCQNRNRPIIANFQFIALFKDWNYFGSF